MTGLSGGLDRGAVVNYSILGLFVVMTLLPLVSLGSSALGPPGASAATVPFSQPPNFANFALAWEQGEFSQYLASSLIVSTSAAFLCCLVSVLAGYALGTMEFVGRDVIFFGFLLGIMVPSEALVVPLYFDLRSLGLTDTYWSLILPQLATTLSFGVFWMRAYFRAVPVALGEAAEVDGASRWAVLVRIHLPLARPAVLTLALLTFMWTWNEFLLPLVMISTEELRTAPLGLSFFRGQHVTQYSLLSAAALIVAAPVVVLYVFMNRRFVAGMMTGALKE